MVSNSLLQRALRTALAAVLFLALVPAGAAGAETGRGKAGESPGHAGGLDGAVRGGFRGPEDTTRGAETAAGDTAEAEYVPGELLVRFRFGTIEASKRSAHTLVGGTKARSFSLVPGLELVKLPPGRSVADAVRDYGRFATVEYAQPNYVKRATSTIPDDPSFADLWGLHNTGQSGGTVDADIDAPEAWDMTTGSGDVVVAVLDTGIDYDHPDLAGNLWTNPGETPDNGVDDDGNGYADDVYGIDTAYGDSDPFDGQGHGTHCAGTVGASGDNSLGITGVNWDVSIMAVKMLDNTGYGDTAGVIEAIEYADMMGADVLSNSWGGYYFDQAEYDAIAAVDRLFVFAAGNEARNNDTVSPPHNPSSYDLDNILAVGASDNQDERASFSNYGAQTVDVFAPGVDILSTIPGSAGPESDVISTVFTDNMSDLGNWVADAGDYPWVLTTAEYTSPPTSAARVGYVNNEYSYLELEPPGLDLSGTQDLWLNAQIMYHIEDMYDFLSVWAISDQLPEWKLLGAFTGDSAGQFQDCWFDMRMYSHNTGVLLAFDFESDESLDSGDGYTGVYVDDVRIVEAIPDHDQAYAENSGTSMATPHVSGLAALILSADPSMSWSDLKQTIMDSVDVLPSLSGLCQTGGRVNAYNALLMVDQTAPVSSSDAVASYNDVAVIALSAQDDPAGSGVESIYYSVDGSPTQTYSSAISVTAYGPHTLEFWAEDVAGNVETPHNTANFTVQDTIAPTSSSNALPAYHMEAEITLTAQDTPGGSGSKAIHYILDGNPETTYTAPIFVNTQSDYTLEFWAEDFAGNVETPHNIVEFTVTVDETPPVTTWPNAPAQDSWVKPPVVIDLSASDDISEVKETWYRTDPTASFQLYDPASKPMLASDGAKTVEFYSVDKADNQEDPPTSVSFSIDGTPPRSEATYQPWYEDRAEIALEADEVASGSGVDAIYYRLDEASAKKYDPATRVVVATTGTHTLEYWAVDKVGNQEQPHNEATFNVVAGNPSLIGVAGATRYETAIEASKRAYPTGSSTVVVATGANWPDALGGAALAGTVDGPLLLTTPTSLPSAVSAEIARLGARHAYILGGTGAVAPAVEAALDAQLSGTVTRLAGVDRYGTAAAVANKVVELTGSSFSGKAFVATGANFPDALGASPLAASSRTPILLAPYGGSPYLPAAVESAAILGGTGAVSATTETSVKSALGTANVTRVGGADRYETAALVAEHGVSAGMHWDGVGIATGAAFPDALSGGAMLGSFDSVLLLTPAASLAPAAEQRLSSHEAQIGTVHFIGGTGAVSQSVRDRVAQVLQ